jgi:transglutaminase-like putative cysteine protease
VPAFGQDNSKDDIIYDVVDQIDLVNNGGGNANINLAAALIHSIAPYQDVTSTEVNPQLNENFSDEYGNQYARFILNLAPGSRQAIKIRYQILVHSMHSNLSLCNGTLPNEFVNAEKYIESNALPIIDLNKRLAQGTKNPCEKSRAFYNYVVDNMRYSGYNPSDVGALEALKSLSGDCTEYSDLLTALNRAAGIPAITVDGLKGTTDSGYIQGENKHNWLEVYLPGSGWVPMDPILGKNSPQDRETYFAGITPDHIIVTKGRSPAPLNSYHYFAYTYTYTSRSPMLVTKETWSILKHEDGL